MDGVNWNLLQDIPNRKDEQTKLDRGVIVTTKGKPKPHELLLQKNYTMLQLDSHRIITNCNNFLLSENVGSHSLPYSIWSIKISPLNL